VQLKSSFNLRCFNIYLNKSKHILSKQTKNSSVKMKKLFALLFVAAFAVNSTFANILPVDSDPPTIVGVAAANENFSTLVAAVKAADLVTVLNSDGPFTVFAPTNAAFEKLAEGTVATLLKPESKETLTAVLTYHVVAGKFKAADVLAAIKKNEGSFTIPTVQGGTLTASLKDGNVILTDAVGNISTIVITDVEASNGIIHAIDTVVMPK
jgi:uncharacterized surface protein with fasciclin (FAS1) repeats